MLYAIRFDVYSHPPLEKKHILKKEHIGWGHAWRKNLTIREFWFTFSLTLFYFFYCQNKKWSQNVKYLLSFIRCAFVACSLNSIIVWLNLFDLECKQRDDGLRTDHIHHQSGWRTTHEAFVQSKRGKKRIIWKNHLILHRCAWFAHYFSCIHVYKTQSNFTCLFHLNSTQWTHMKYVRNKFLWLHIWKLKRKKQNETCTK